jgi:polysaccharide biosynthesis transport protein
MLQINKSRPSVPAVLTPELLSPTEIYATVASFLHRQFTGIVFMFIVTVLLGAVYIFTSPAYYTGHAVLVIDTQKNRVFEGQSPFGDLPLDSAAVDTQIAILSSQKIALSVIKDLHLNEDPEFISPRIGILGTVAGFVTIAISGALNFISPSPQSVDEPSAQDWLTQIAVNTFQNNLTVQRVGMTYAIDIGFRSLNASRAAEIANAVANAYIVDSLEAKYDITRRAGVWLQERLKDLREQASEAERAVVDYKAKNNIVETGGELMNQQQLAELNSELVQTQAATAEAKARLERVEQLVKSGDVDPTASATGTVADALHNDIITKLREQYLEDDQRATDWAAKYGATHLAVVNLRDQMAELRASIFDELKRTAETYQSDYQIAKTREDSIQKSLDQTIAQSQTTNQAQVTLHNLESSAQTYRALYDNFLQRYMESVQQESFPISDARVITQATRPMGKSSPRSFVVMALAALGGLLAGVSLGILRDVADRVFRTSSQVTEHLQAECIALIPTVKDRPKAGAAEKKRGGSRAAAGRTIVRDTSVHWTVLDAPLSRFAESIRAIKVAIDLENAAKPSKVIGITSSLPNEGKSTIALSLATLIAHGRGRVLLVDCDLRNPSLSKELAPNVKVGLLDVIGDKTELDQVLWTEPTSGLAFLPAAMPKRLAHSSEILASEATRTLFEKLRESYEYIIVDLSPLAPVVDVRVITPLIDSFLFVAEWGRTKIDVAEHALSNARGVYENLLGVALNKTDMNTLGRYESSRGNYYYNEYYARYGYTD